MSVVVSSGGNDFMAEGFAACFRNLVTMPAIGCAPYFAAFAFQALSGLKPPLTMLNISVGSDISTKLTTCPATSCTVQPEHKLGACSWSSVSPSIKSANSRRDCAAVVQLSVIRSCLSKRPVMPVFRLTAKFASFEAPGVSGGTRQQVLGKLPG